MSNSECKLVSPAVRFTCLTLVAIFFVISALELAAQGTQPAALDVYTAGQAGYATYRIPSLLLTPKNMRSCRGKQCRAFSISKDGGVTWSEIRDDEALIEPVSPDADGEAGDAERGEKKAATCDTGRGGIRTHG